MRKQNIARRIHQEAGISEQAAAALLEWILDLLKITLQKGEPISIHEFGKFTVRGKVARKGRNPRTGEAMIISARRVVTFRPSILFTAAMKAVQQQTGNAN